MRLTPDWAETVFDQLDRRLARDVDYPVAVAVSGGGDSVALLHLAAHWAARRGRRLLVLSVDHALNPAAAAWTAQVEAIARSLNAGWRGLIWSGDKPLRGLPAAARQARHALLSNAARTAGARVILMGHTADDIAEADWMRAQGTPLGQLKDWSPSPVWPEGRGLMLLRPLLDLSRQALRDWLAREKIPWIEDPANADPRFLRSRARVVAPRRRPRIATPLPPNDLRADLRSGIVSGPPATIWLAQAVVCASGGQSVPSAAAIQRARARIADSTGALSLSGALVRVEAGQLVVSRELGRRPPPAEDLERGTVHIWDGRFALKASEPGWRVDHAAGHRARLSPEDRNQLNLLPVEARHAHPVLLRESSLRPVLADPAIEALCLVPERLRLVTGQAQTEDDL